jgi:hypothetical protein
MNVPWRDEPMATDTIQSDTPAIDGGKKYAQFFVRVRSLLSDVHGMKSPPSFPGVLTDQIIDPGAPTKLISDSAKVETSTAVHGILHKYGISSWQSEPYHQHQNPAKWCYQMVKCMCNTILDHMGAPAYCWLLCLMYVCVVLNNTYAPNIHATPLRMVTGTTNDISQLLYFSFYEPMYYHNDSPFPSASKECCGRWVGISENVGNFMMFKILTNDTHKIIYRSNLRSACDPNARNLRIDPLNTTSPEIICSLCTASPALDHGEDLLPLSLLMTVDTANKTIWLLLTHMSSWDVLS